MIGYNRKLRYEYSKKGIETRKKYRLNYGSLCSNIKKREKSYGIDSLVNIDMIKAIFKIFNFKCFNCNSTSNLCLDHFNPIRYRIPIYLDNCLLLCTSCNSKKNRKNPKDFFSPVQLEILRSEYGLKPIAIL